MNLPSHFPQVLKKALKPLLITGGIIAGCSVVALSGFGIKTAIDQLLDDPKPAFSKEDPNKIQYKGKMLDFPHLTCRVNSGEKIENDKVINAIKIYIRQKIFLPESEVLTDTRLGEYIKRIMIGKAEGYPIKKLDIIISNFQFNEKDMKAFSKYLQEKRKEICDLVQIKS